MAVETTPTFLYMGPILIGLIISLIELIFVHADEGGLGWLGHGLHAIPATIFFTFLSMNVPWLLSFSIMNWVPALAANIGIPVVIGIIAAIKVKAAAAIARGGSVGEKLWHALAIGALIALAPFVWPLIVHFLPEFLAR